MMPWLEIDSDPPRTYRNGAGEGARLDHPLLASLSALRRPLSIPGISPAETPNLTVELDNAGGAITAHYGQRPPLRAAARVVDASGVLFDGTVTALDLGRSAAVQIESGAFRPLSDPLPLRNTVLWGAYKDVRTLPHVYGRATIAPIPYDQAGRLFLLADHPVQAVARVTRDDAPTDAWALSNELDTTGRAVAVLELSEPLAPAERLTVTLIGKMDSATGNPIDSPAAVVWDLLSNVMGVPVPWSRFDAFRAETQGLVIGGVVDDARATTRATIDRILQSVGAAWSAGMREIAFLWPAAPDVSAPALRVDRINADDVRAVADHAGLVTVLRVLYDYDNAERNHRRAIQMEAPEAIQRYGRIEAEWDAGWLRSPRLAETLGRRMLRMMARPRWRVTWRQRFEAVAPGAWCDIDHAQIPVSGRHRMVSADLDFSGPVLTCAIDAAVGDAPDIQTTALATAFEPLVAGGAAVEYVDGVATFTIRDDTGRPLSGARTTLNGTTTRIADNAGRVSFEVARGRHVLYVEATGYAPMEIEVVI